MKAIVSADGLMAQAVNPYEKDTFDYNGIQAEIYAAWLEFEKANPPIPLTIPKTPCKEIEVKEVWQIEHTRGWGTLRADEAELYVNSNATTRIAFEPLTQMSNEKNKAEGVEENLNKLASVAYPSFERIGDNNCGLNYDDLRSIQREVYKFGIKAGKNIQRKDPAFIAEIVEKTLAFVAEKANQYVDLEYTSLKSQNAEPELIGITIDKVGILELHPNIVNQILKEKI